MTYDHEIQIKRLRAALEDLDPLVRRLKRRVRDEFGQMISTYELIEEREEAVKALVAIRALAAAPVRLHEWSKEDQGFVQVTRPAE